VGLLQLRFDIESAARGARSFGPCGPSLSSPAAQSRWAWLSAIPLQAHLWGIGGVLSGDCSTSGYCACLHVKSVREPDDRNGQVRFDERGEETELWTSRRKRPRKASLASGAAGPARHRASPRLYQQSIDGGPR